MFTKLCHPLRAFAVMLHMTCPTRNVSVRRQKIGKRTTEAPRLIHTTRLTSRARLSNDDVPSLPHMETGSPLHREPLSLLTSTSLQRLLKTQTFPVAKQLKATRTHHD